jgi:hypothetical protein
MGVLLAALPWYLCERIREERLGAGSGAEGVKAFQEAALELIRSHRFDVLGYVLLRARRSLQPVQLARAT